MSIPVTELLAVGGYGDWKAATVKGRVGDGFELARENERRNKSNIFISESIWQCSGGALEVIKVWHWISETRADSTLTSLCFSYRTSAKTCYFRSSILATGCCFMSYLALLRDPAEHCHSSHLSYTLSAAWRADGCSCVPRSSRGITRFG
jgi:hypothetical protein